MPKRPIMEFEESNEIVQYFNPPSWFIPSLVFDFYKKYRYYKTFNTAPQYEDQNEKFLVLWTVYENTLSECKEAVWQMQKR